MNFLKRLLRPKRIGLMAPALILDGDAVGNDVLGMYHALNRAGFRADIFLPNPIDVPGLSIRSYGEAADCDLLLYHHCIHDTAALEIGRTAKRFVFRYHNVTPSHFFNGYSQAYVEATEQGRAMVSDLIKIPNVSAIAASGYNKAELVALGMPVDRIAVVPPFHQTDDLLSQSSGASDGGMTVLTVGRIVPNKGLDLLLECFADVTERLPAPVQLHIVGGVDDRLSAYRDALGAIIERRGIADRVVFHGKVTKEKLANLYHQCALYWTCSQHEGFCVPVVEAMAFGKPILATPRAALPETCGDAAELASTREEMVEAAVALLSDAQRRADLAVRATRRYADLFGADRIQKRFLDALPGIRWP